MGADDRTVYSADLFRAHCARHYAERIGVCGYRSAFVAVAGADGSYYGHYDESVQKHAGLIKMPMNTLYDRFVDSRRDFVINEPAVFSGFDESAVAQTF